MASSDVALASSRKNSRVSDGSLSYDEIRQQCAQLPAGALWEDRQFSGNAALYKPRSTCPKYNKGEPIKWLRPTEVHGADATGEKMALITDGLEAGDVQQGELGDCYLLGAMAAVASASDDSKVQGELIYKLLKQSDRDKRKADLRSGFCTFTLYKFGVWTEVTVDTLIPCSEASRKPLFARCKDPNELWVPLLEKAYAKLHGSYEALDGGSVTAALVDLTGGIAETLDLTEEDELQDLHNGSMWKRMKRYAGGGLVNTMYLLGAARANNELKDNGKEDMIEMTEQNIIVNHAYTLLEAKEVGLTGQAEKVKLLKLRNPWGMREWDGPWGDGKGEWETALGQQAKKDLGYKEEDDGCFWISWGDFQNHFNRIYVCRVAETCDGSQFTPEAALRGNRVPEGTWCEYALDGEWTDRTAGGCFNFPSWRSNPQYEIIIGKETHAFFVLMQPDPRMEKGRSQVLTGPEGGPKYEHKIGMYVMKGHADYRRKIIYDSEEIDGDDVLDSTPYIEYREVQCNTMDEEGESKLQQGARVVLCPSTFQPNKPGKFRLIVLTDSALSQPPTLLPPLTELRCAGVWGAGTAGGCRNFASWRSNVQYHLKLSRTARVSVVLMRHDEKAINSEKPLGANKKRARNPERRTADKNLYIGFVVVRPPAGHPDRRLLDVKEEAVLEKTSYVATAEVAREFHGKYVPADPRYPQDSFVIVPTTFKPGMHSGYELVVYTDDEAATLRPLPDTSWHHTAAKGEWAGKSAGGSRNNPSWVRNPLYSVRSSRDALVHIFLRQPSLPDPPAGAAYEGIGFYVALDDASLELRDVVCESGFRRKEEVHAELRLEAGKEYLLIPMTYKKGVQSAFDLELFSDQPLAFAKLTELEADGRRRDQLEDEAARIIIQHWVRARIRRALRHGGEKGRQEARALMQDFFRMPSRNCDEGYLDINLALNALESAFISLTGNGDAKGSFFPRMRERLKERNHKVADYDVCL